jgi:hypothetical protein
MLVMNELFPELSAKCEKAREALLERMTRRGLLYENGWRIYEFTRQVGGRTELVLRPVHAGLTSPEELECICRIEEPGSTAVAECRE